MLKQRLGYWTSRVLLATGFDLHGWLRRLTGASPFTLAQPEIGLRSVSSPDHHVFFGYYDVTPFSPDERLLLAARVARTCHVPAPGVELEVGFYEWQSDSPPFHPLGTTTSWCWQQGCRLQWFPGREGRTILYNRLGLGRYECVVQPIQDRSEIQTYSRPLYAVSPDGRWGFSLNFSRLHRLRPGYGYTGLDDATVGDLAPGSDGLWRVDLETGESNLLISLAEMAEFEAHESMRGAEHYFNHVCVNPASDRLMFFHLWGRGAQRKSRLVTCNLEGGERCILSNEGHVSHYTWKNSRELLVYATHAETGTGFHLYIDQTDQRTPLGREELREDSHPSYSPGGRYLLLDSYPNGYRRQHLFLFDNQQQRRIPLAAFYAPVRFDETVVRCDLHPRWSPTGRYLCVDSVCPGRRALFVLDLHPIATLLKGTNS